MPAGPLSSAGPTMRRDNTVTPLTPLSSGNPRGNVSLCGDLQLYWERCHMKPCSGPPRWHGRLQRLRAKVRESQGSAGVGERRDSACLRNSYFPHVPDKPVASDTSTRSD